MLSRSAILLTCLCALVLAAVAAPPVRAETIIPGNYVVSSTETWDLEGSPYIVQGSLSVASGGHLILEPGVEVQIQSGRVFEVQNGGTLTAEGTTLDPTTITAISGQFVGLRLRSGGHTSLAHCDISSAGSGGYPAVDIQTSDVTLDHCAIHDSAARGIQMAGAGLSPAITNTTVEDNAGDAVYQSTIDMTPTYANLTLAGNGTDAVVWNSGSLNRALTLDGPQLNGCPFIALDSVNVNDGGHLTLTADTELLMPAGRGLYVQSGGALAAEGVQADPVTITAREPGSPFIGVVFVPGSSGNLAYCDIHQAGASGYPAVRIQSSAVSLEHCVLHGSLGNGIELQNAGLTPAIKHTTIQDNGGYAIYQSTIDMTPTYQNLTISGNGTNAVVWSTGYLNRPLTLDGLQLGGRPFIALDSVNVNDGGHLTLNPGTEMRMQASKGLWVQSGGTLTAAGTAAAPAVLTAREAEAPFVKLCFLPGSAGSLAYLDLSRAGASESRALDIQSSDVSLNHCTIRDNVTGSTVGLYLQGAGLSPTIANTTVRDNSGRAVHQSTIDMNPVYANLTLTGNATDAVVFANGALHRAVTLDGSELNGSPFIGLDQINIYDGAHLTLAPGTELRMSASEAIYVESGGALTAVGTPGQPVVLTSVEPGARFYKVHFLPGSTSSLAYCDVSRAGASGFDALAIYTPDVDLSHCIIHDNAAWGVRLFSQAGAATLDNMVFMDNAGGGLLVDSGVVATLRHATIARNGSDGVRIVQNGSAAFSNTIVAANPTGVRVDAGGSATMVHTLWDGNTEDVVGTLEETGHFEGPAAFEPDGYHLTASSAALQMGTSTPVIDDIDGDARPLPPGTDPDLGADELPATSTSWQKWVEGQTWQPGLTLTVEISQLIEVVDTVRAAPNTPFTLSESWIPAHLSLVGYALDPSAGSEVTLAPGSLSWEAAVGHPEILTLTKQFHVEPGDWAESGLEESLEGLDIPDPSRPVSFCRSPVHDLAVVGASPEGEVPVGSAANVTAEVLNGGTEAESGAVVQCTIEDPTQTEVYHETKVTGTIAPASWTLLMFAAWTPAVPGVHTLTCQSTLPGDMYTDNDSQTNLITAIAAGAPDVWTRDNRRDTGNVPSRLPWWVSPDIWVRHQPDGGLVHQNPIPLQDNTVYVRLRNRGQQAASGQVHVYWSRFWIAWPCRPGLPNVGVIEFEDLLPGEVRIVSLQWEPQGPGIYGLHTVIDAEGDPPRWQAICSPFRPRWDNNISWRNTLVYYRWPGAAPWAVTEEQVVLANVFEWPKEIDLVVERETYPLTATLTLLLGDELFDRWQNHEGHWSEGVTVLTPTKEIEVTGAISSTVGAIPMGAGEQVTATLRLGVPEEGAFRTMLWERIDGSIVGGVTCEWVVSDLLAPEVSAHFPANDATEVGLHAPMVITFTEEIGPLSLDLTLAPEVQGWSLSWNGTGTVVTATHAGLAPGTEYMARVMGSDAFANPMATPYTWSFTAQSAWRLYLPLVLR